MPIAVSAFPDVEILPYEKARKDIRSGDILLCSGSSVFSTLIQAATGSIWSHVGFILKIKEIDRLMVMESVESIGVRTVPLSYYVYNYEGKGRVYPGKILIARHSSFSMDKLKAMSVKAVDLLGHLYDKNEIFKIGARIGLGTFIPKEECQLPERDREYICSEYVYEIYNSIGLNVSHDCGGFVTPADFARTDEINSVVGIAT